MRTLQEARNHVMNERGEGIICPCCDQLAKVYRRAITCTSARILIAMVKGHLVEPRWIHVSELWMQKLGSGSGDVAKLAYWDLVKAKPHDETDTTKTASGWWKPTPYGISFAFGRIQVRKHVLIYNAERLGREGDLVGIREALGKKFDYAALMNGVM
ncbi:MAG: hypothetical protein GY906_23420 [bacterium]|nr:hypothetical protein [bacterium]